jgi:hypothetical protein
MKVILSRKGFDSEYGGGPSPILDGKRLVSLPIKYDKETRRRYNELQLGGENLGLLIESLLPRRSGPSRRNVAAETRLAAAVWTG